ncbi:MAG: ATPase [Moorellales bacterium]
MLNNGGGQKDIFSILDQMEQFLEGATRIPLTGRVVIEAQTLLNLIDQLRAMLPAEIGEAQRLARERDKVLAEARRQAELIREAANQEIEKRLQDTEIIREAQVKAQEILRRAEATARDIHQGAEGYADEILNRLELALDKALASVRQGRQELRTRRTKSA